MSAWNGHPEQPEAGAAWRALSGELPAPPQLSGAQPQPVPVEPQPIAGGWTQPWQDEHGQWHYPYAAAQPMEQPPYDAAAAVVQPQPHEYQVPLAPVGAPAPPAAPAPPVETIVPVEELAPVGPPRYLAPAAPAQDPRRRTMAAVITFVSLLIALWAILAFMGSMAATLSSVSSGTSKLKVQLGDANAGLAKLDEKTSHLEKMSADTKTLAGLLGTIDKDMGGMLADVETIAGGMSSMNASLGELTTEVESVNTINADMSSKLGSISTGLGTQVASVRSMRKDVQGTSTVLNSLPGRLAATNGRLGYVNNAVNIMGCRGITNNLEVEIKLGPIPNGSAKVFATVVPPGAWGSQANGQPCTPVVTR